jgi:enterochelin esterase-like enzyme
MKQRPLSPGSRTVLWTLVCCGLSHPAPGADPPSAGALLARQRAESSPVWADGDVATFVFQGEADRVELRLGGDPETRPLTRLPGSDVWTVRLEKPGLERGVFTYWLTSTRAGHTSGGDWARPRYWRGPKAPPAVEVREALQGVLEVAELASPALGASRKITTYVPPGHDRHRPSPVVYVSDGEGVKGFARVVEPMVVAGRIPPVVLVGVHAGGYLGPRPKGPIAFDPNLDLRLQEYIPSANPKRFADHETFFVKEVPAWAEKRFGVSADREDRAVSGYSNGGRFAAEMGFRHPEVFGHAFCFSVAGDAAKALATKADQPVRFYLAAGTWEPIFHRLTAKLADALKERGVAVTFSSRVAAHDEAMWREEFADAVLSAFGGRRG